LADAGADGEVGLEGQLGLAGAVRDDRGHAVLAGQIDRAEGLGNGADLVGLDEDRVGGVPLDRGADPVGMGHEQVRHLGGRQLPAVLGQVVSIVVEELRRRDVQGDGDLLAGQVAGPLDRGHEQLQRLLIGLDRRSEAALVADGGRPAPLGDEGLEVVVDLGPPADGLDEGQGADGHDHVLLEVGGARGVRAPVEDVHQWDRHGEAVGRVAADLGDVVIEGDLPGDGSSLEAGEIFSVTLRTASRTPRPRYRLGSLSLSSRASKMPVEAPDGAMAEAVSW
jgi:hypothetical protein